MCDPRAATASARTLANVSDEWLMDESLKRILESKAAYRRELARKPVAEKLRIVEQMAERTRAIRQSRERGKRAGEGAVGGIGNWK